MVQSLGGVALPRALVLPLPPPLQIQLFHGTRCASRQSLLFWRLRLPSTSDQRPVRLAGLVRDGARKSPLLQGEIVRVL